MKAGQWAGGKGDKERISDYKAYTSNYDKIFNKSKRMKACYVAVLKWDVYSDDYECPKAVDLLEGDVIEWEFLTDDVEITIKEECFSVGEASGRGGSIFTVPKDKFVTEYKPALSNS